MIRDCFGASLVDSTVTPRSYSAWLGGTNLDRFVSGYTIRVLIGGTHNSVCGALGFTTRAWPANLAATDFYMESLILSLSILSSTFLQSQDTVDNLQDRKSQNVRSAQSRIIL